MNSSHAPQNTEAFSYLIEVRQPDAILVAIIRAVTKQPLKVVWRSLPTYFTNAEEGRLGQ